MSKRRNDGWVGWLLLLLVVIVWDVFAQKSDGQTMTGWWREALHGHPLVGVVLWFIGGSVGGHLFVSPRWFHRFDVIHLSGKLS